MKAERERKTTHSVLHLAQTGDGDDGGLGLEEGGEDLEREERPLIRSRQKCGLEERELTLEMDSGVIASRALYDSSRVATFPEKICRREVNEKSQRRKLEARGE